MSSLYPLAASKLFTSFLIFHISMLFSDSSRAEEGEDAEEEAFPALDDTADELDVPAIDAMVGCRKQIFKIKGKEKSQIRKMSTFLFKMHSFYHFIQNELYAWDFCLKQVMIVMARGYCIWSVFPQMKCSWTFLHKYSTPGDAPPPPQLHTDSASLALPTLYVS